MLHTCGNVAGEQRLVTRLLPNIRSESPQRCGFKINFRPESVSGRLVPEVRIAAVLPDLVRLALLGARAVLALVHGGRSHGRGRKAQNNAKQCRDLIPTAVVKTAFGE